MRTFDFTLTIDCVIFITVALKVVNGETMPIPISIILGNKTIPAELNDSKTARELLAKLPIESEYSTWGDELYFPVPVKMGSENSKNIVELGEITYWPPGKAFCIFYGATPGSTENEIRPASPVNPLGYITGDPKIFKTLVKNTRIIKLEKA